METVTLLNGDFDAVSLDETVSSIVDFIKAGERGYLCTVNVAILMMMRENPRLQSFVDKAAFVVADGQPIIWASRLMKNPLPERVTGVDLVEELAERAATEKLPIYLLGATKDVVAEVAERLTRRYPGLEIAGTADGYFGADEAPARAEAVAASGAKILFVGMGVPRQEVFLEEQWERLGVSLAIPVGGSFEVLAGRKTRAPEFVQKVGMEWAFRFAQEPKRLGKRYLVTNTQFILRLSKALALGSRRSPARRAWSEHVG